MDNEARREQQSRKRDLCVSRPRGHSAEAEGEGEEQRWLSEDLYSAKVHGEATVIQGQEVRHPALHASDLLQWHHKGLLVSRRLHKNFLLTVQPQEGH